ncbi:MAG: hypothetical protein DCF20_15805 [Pseudanabaena sp.]|nr:MAG: hypothetical protein DCF20_15805 [Pseudanabaena sp.]
MLGRLAITFMGAELRSLVNVEGIGDRGYWVLWGNYDQKQKIFKNTLEIQLKCAIIANLCL